jgi:hypothetical protein
VATNISHEHICAPAAGVSRGRNWPVSRPDSRMALLSSMVSAGVLPLGVDGAKRRQVLLALAGVHRDHLLGKAGLFEVEGYFERVGRGVVVEFEHKNWACRGWALTLACGFCHHG